MVKGVFVEHVCKANTSTIHVSVC